MTLPILALSITHEDDIVAVRQRAREIADLLGFEQQDQTRIATAVSEIVRNAYAYAGGGSVRFAVEGRTPPQLLTVTVSDEGPGIERVADILEGRYRSSTGMGLGVVGAQRLMDQFRLDSAPGRGTTVTLGKLFSRRAPMLTPRRLQSLVERLAHGRPESPLAEIRRQNQALLQALDEVRRRQDALTRLNRELEDTNRGVVALYAELAEKADHLRQADELKSRFLSNMSHEFRTPLHSILALVQILIDRTDGDLTAEQDTQMDYIQKSARELLQLVEDLLDLAKVEAGTIVVRPAEFTVEDLFSTLRGMLRPLLVNESVSLIFEDPGGCPTLCTDEGKVSQILRNFISNALKFTERGEVRVTAAPTGGGEALVFSVADTGIGIAPEHQELIFKEFGQVEGPRQKYVKGTGLGLPLSRKLAELLGGRVAVQSQPGRGSTFTFTVPVRFAPPAPDPDPVRPEADGPDPSRQPVLIIEDSPESRLAYDRFLADSAFQPFCAATLREAEEFLTRIQPAAIVLDIRLAAGDAWKFLARLKGDGATRGIPVVVATHVEDYHKGMALGADAYLVKPVGRDALLANLERLTRQRASRRVLIVDDNEGSRYVLRQLLPDRQCAVSEAASGAEGLRLARAERPDLILLDLVMPDMNGLEVLDRLRADSATAELPVVVVTAKRLSAEEQSVLAQRNVPIVPKPGDHVEAASAALRDLWTKLGLPATAA
jgi:signal transduction histidine kinase/CheY-like chemotaxis protein